ncbi:hypothetical protein ACIA8E_21465 [Streptomyces sp. NPDC051664]|uniref:hypothetical protein n=1 Tax=Streptomyces sp. NPDC051664 TaxID=3365668 RepID=UPI00379B796D
MPDLTPILRRVSQLCESLESDADLREEIERAGFPSENWEELAAAIRAGSADALTDLLDAVEDAAADAGLDGVTGPNREYKPLPSDRPDGLGGFRTVSGWRCPHPYRCGRAYAAVDPSPIRRCAVTGDALTWISVESG